MIDPSSVRQKLHTKANILSLLPHLYLAVTQLLAAHSKQSVNLALMCPTSTLASMLFLNVPARNRMCQREKVISLSCRLAV